MRPGIVVPFHGRQKLNQECFTPIGHVGQASEQAFDRQDDAFNHGNGTVFA
jgi:hypothetical protein